ncbi:TetR/AcrR family transcriptional regulator [Stackebrandtia soli]|uniref:TetR/AcrR family transcriptional regulator n=1 Tax=Stackebrandtia soli TaxID=1892856 RepID=UPI0039ED0184
MTIAKGVGKRAEKARKTRQKILAAAGELFVRHGYGTTTLQDVAAEAGVAVQTIYFVFGNKRTLVKELVDVTIAGDDADVPTVDRLWFVSAVGADTGAELLERLTSGSGEVIARVAPILKVIETAAATDAELADAWNQDEDPRHIVMTHAATSLIDKPDARPGVTVETAADVMYGLLSPELYRVMVTTRHWSHDRWAQWTIESLTEQLCGD